MKYLSILPLIVLILGVSSPVKADYDFIDVQVCNKGNTMLYVANAELKWGGGLLVSGHFELSGWYHIDVGECRNIGDSDRNHAILVLPCEM